MYHLLFVNIFENGVREHKVRQSIAILNKIILIECELVINDIYLFTDLMLYQTIIIINLAHLNISDKLDS